MSRSIMLNGVKATITFHDTIDADKPTINWELIMESGNNKAAIDGSISMSIKLFEPGPSITPSPLKPEECNDFPDTILSIDTFLKGTKAPVAPTYEDMKNHIFKCINVEDSVGKKQKASPPSIAPSIALDPVVSEEERKKIEDRRREERREKREEMKRRKEEDEEVKDKAPTVTPVVPVTPTDEDMKNHIFKCIKAVEDSVGTKEKAKLAKILYDYMTNESLDYVKGYEKLKKVAIERAYYIKRKCEEFPELTKSLNVFLTAVGAPLDEPVVECVKYCTCDKCIEKQTMKEIMKQEDEYCKRWQLMKKLFKEENLVFDDDNVMDLYYEWEETVPRLNRYEKMKAFIDANRDSFENEA